VITEDAAGDSRVERRKRDGIRVFFAKVM